MPRPRNRQTSFPQPDADALRELGDIFCRNHEGDDRKVADALVAAFRVLEGRVAAFRTASERRRAYKEFGDLIAHDARYAADSLIDACLNGGRYELGIEACALLERLGLKSGVPLAVDRAELLTRQGLAEAAERLLLDLLADRPDDARIHVALGDTSFVFEPQHERRDIGRAEDWYYRAYDNGLADEDTEAGRTLLSRLGAACIERLREGSERRLIATLATLDIGTWRTAAELREDAWTHGERSPLLAHVRAEVRRLADGERLERALGAIDTAFHLMPQDALDGYSPFEAKEFFPPGEHETRIMNEASFVARDGIAPFTASGRVDEDVARGRRGLLLDDFLRGKDAFTGKKRAALIEEERRRTRDLFAEGRLPWSGFLRFRQAHVLGSLGL